MIKTEENDIVEKENCNSVLNFTNIVNCNYNHNNPFDEYNPNDANYNFYCNDDRLSNLNNYDFKNSNMNFRNSDDDNERNGFY